MLHIATAKAEDKNQDPGCVINIHKQLSPAMQRMLHDLRPAVGAGMWSLVSGRHLLLDDRLSWGHQQTSQNLKSTEELCQKRFESNGIRSNGLQKMAAAPPRGLLRTLGIVLGTPGLALLPATRRYTC